MQIDTQNSVVLTRESTQNHTSCSAIPLEPDSVPVEASPEADGDGPRTDTKASGEMTGAGDRARLLDDLDAMNSSRLAGMPSDVKAAAREMLVAPDLIDRIHADIATLGVVGEENLAMAVYLILTSRLLNQPLSGIVQGSSSSGKSYVISTVSDFMPTESKLMATDITSNALYYLGQSELIHRAVVAGERPRKNGDTKAEATRALREMQSSAKLSKLVTLPGGVAALIERHGPIAYLESTTADKVFDEDANRALLLEADESKEQTVRILEAQAHSATQPCDREGRQALIEKHYALQRMLKRVDVVIPFAQLIANLIPSTRPCVRRAFTQVLNLVRAVTLLHQYQRYENPDHGAEIHATVKDYAVARRLAIGPLGRLLKDDLSSAKRQLAETLWDSFGETEFTANDAKAVADYGSREAMATALKKLEKQDIVDLIRPSKGPNPHIWRMNGPPQTAGARLLPLPEAVDDLLGEGATD